MATLSIRQVKFDQLRNKGKDSATVVKLMMACNDISLANQSLDDWKKSQPADRKDRQIGARMYFVRLQFSHLFEGLKVVKKIDQTPSLKMLLQQCDIRTRDSFSELLKHAHGGENHTRLTKLIGRLRHNITFHYDDSGTLINQAIINRSSRPESNLSKITRASTAHRWRFDIADDLIDTVVVRQIWEVPATAELCSEVDTIADELHEIFIRFMDFSGEFIWKYCE